MSCIVGLFYCRTNYWCLHSSTTAEGFTSRPFFSHTPTRSFPITFEIQMFHSNFLPRKTGQLPGSYSSCQGTYTPRYKSEHLGGLLYTAGHPDCVTLYNKLFLRARLPHQSPSKALAAGTPSQHPWQSFGHSKYCTGFLLLATPPSVPGT